jgi:nicotinamide-nucleotide amidase
MDFTQQVNALSKVLMEKKSVVVTAESCTGGMIAEALTSIGGSTAWFDRAYVSYSYESKQEMLGIDEQLIMHHGAVSEACVKEMVVGALQRSHANLAVACSGIAGPSGGSPDKPIGTVWLAWGKQGLGHVETQCFSFEGDRQQIREATTNQALLGLHKLVS